MLKAINTKLLIAVLAALAALAAVLVHVCNDSAKAARILQQQQDEANAVKKHDAETWDFVRKQRQKQNSNATGGSKTWTTYVP